MSLPLGSDDQQPADQRHLHARSQIIDIEDDHSHHAQCTPQAFAHRHPVFFKHQTGKQQPQERTGAA